jgi:hypothetical protein
LSIKGKVKVIQETEKKEEEEEKEKTDMCQEFYIINSTIQMICKDRTKIISVIEQNRSRIQQFPVPE